MPRYFVHIAYNGKNYHGWQRQPNGISVQEAVETALSILLKEKLSVTGCGRTDAGVHARDFYFHYDFAASLDEAAVNDIAYRLNRYLPGDIVVFRMFRPGDDFHARFSASSRTYVYQISRRKDPFANGLAWIMDAPLNIDLMKVAANSLIGTADFTCFSKSNTDTKTNMCTITKALWSENDNILSFEITADRFLRNMVRAVVGTHFNIGKGKMSLEDYKKLLVSGNRSDAGESVPAHGLYLTKVEYPFF
jgi:tRNA pseudouridine38-40 synthase